MGVLRVAEATSHTLADCESTAGYFERALELVGGSSRGGVGRGLLPPGLADWRWAGRLEPRG